MKRYRQGAEIIAKDWMDIKPLESVVILTDVTHKAEMLAVKKQIEKLGAYAVIRLVPKESSQLGEYVENMSEFLQKHEVIIGAANYSLVTTEVVKKAVAGGSRFLSLPLATNDGRSLLEYGLMTMDPGKSRLMAKMLLTYINRSDYIRVETDAGTDLTFRKIGRTASYFNGMAKDGKGFASSSFEVYLPIEEDQTYGVGVLDGSLGYLGKVNESFRIRMEAGKMVEVEASPDGDKLSAYMENFQDENIYYASELGIGLNSYAKCEGNCYIEDESAYGTFHIGFGRNIALGGEFEASGHFDLVFLAPDIYADNRLIMKKGVIIPAEPEIW